MHLWALPMLCRCVAKFLPPRMSCVQFVLQVPDGRLKVELLVANQDT